jgi:aryl-alcohol dehydrogenase-like predicted oxidoreductase
MKFRELGKTGIDVSILSFGASSLGGVFHDINESQGIDTVVEAVNLGVNLIDVSPYYGFTKAEMVLGKALKQIPREKYYLSTKVGRYGSNGIKTWDYSAKRAAESVKESMDRLNIDYIDIINCHDIEFSNFKQIIDETLPALHELKSQGLVGHVGITGLPLDKLHYLVEKTSPGMVETILNFCHYCLNDDSLNEEVDFYQNRGIGIINASPLSMGLLSERGAPPWHPASAKIKNTCIKAAAYCRKQGVRIEQLAVQYSLRNPRIATTLISTSNPLNMIDNIRWVNEDLDEGLLTEVLEILKSIRCETWENS